MLKKLFISIVTALTFSVAACTTPTPVYSVEQIQQADTLEEKATYAVSNGFQAALAAVRTIDENERSGIITREAAARYMERLDVFLDAMNDASRALDEGLFSLALDKATAQKKLIDLLVQELVNVRDN